MRKILLIMVATMIMATACGPVGNPIGNPVHGPHPDSDCYGLRTNLTHTVIDQRNSVGLMHGYVIYTCQRVPVLYSIRIQIQSRLPGRTAWRDRGRPALAEFDKKTGLEPVIGRNYLLSVSWKCQGPFTAYWRLVQTYSGLSESGVPRPPVTVYFPYPDPLEQGIRVRCGEH